MRGASNLRNERDGAAERFVPAEMAGTLTEAEHLGRYGLAAKIAPGRRVLDAGCGTGYGSTLMARSGAASVMGVDIAADVIEAARAASGDGVAFAVGDVRSLPCADASFDLAVCFEVIEHLEGQGAVVDELRRVVTGDGLVLVSSPNRLVYPPGNPHHVHELAPDELEEMLASRFAHVRLMRQHNWVTSAILDDDRFAVSGFDALIEPELHKLAADAPGAETYTIGLASDSPLPAVRSVGVLAAAVELRRWQEDAAIREATVGAQRDKVMRQLDEQHAELVATQSRLAEVEHDLTTRLERAEGVIRGMERSLSWRVTAPLRAAKRVRR